VSRGRGYWLWLPPPPPFKPVTHGRQCNELLHFICLCLYRKREKPTLAEKRQDIEALKVWQSLHFAAGLLTRPTNYSAACSLLPHPRQAQHRASMHLRGSGGGMQPTLSPGDRGMRVWR
jgi:hypothetical protein